MVERETGPTGSLRSEAKRALVTAVLWMRLGKIASAAGSGFWYSLGMKKHRIARRRSSDRIVSMAAGVAEAMAERTRMNLELLQALALAVASNEKTQQRFRNAVLIRLSRIETVVQMIHGAQIVEAHRSEPCFEDKMNEHARDAEEYISEKSNHLGLTMVKYIYGESDEPSPRRGKRRRWSDWEI